MSGAHLAHALGFDPCKPPWTCLSVITPFSLNFVTFYLVICETAIFLKVTLVRITTFNNNDICSRDRTYIRSPSTDCKFIEMFGTDAQYISNDLQTATENL